MFKKKEDKKPGVKVEEPKKEQTFEEYVNSYKRWGNGEITQAAIADAIVLLRSAMKAGQLSGPFNEVCFGIVYTKEEYEDRLKGMHASYTYSRVKYCSSLGDVVFKSAEQVNQERKNDLEQRLFKLQDEQKLKVEEIEKLAKKLGELE
jgi:hypothetical protein